MNRNGNEALVICIDDFAHICPTIAGTITPAMNPDKHREVPAFFDIGSIHIEKQTVFVAGRRRSTSGGCIGSLRAAWSKGSSVYRAIARRSRCYWCAPTQIASRRRGITDAVRIVSAPNPTTLKTFCPGSQSLHIPFPDVQLSCGVVSSLEDAIAQINC